MKKIVIFESSVIGLLVGFVVSTYLVYIYSSEGFLGKILETLSLKSVLIYIGGTNITNNLFISFAFYVAVFVIYGAIIGAIIFFLKKKMSVLIAIAFVIILAGIEQTVGTLHHKPVSPIVFPITAAVGDVIRTNHETKQYFGMEAYGDLNSDNIDDVAFIISRNDPDRGELYYLSSALSTNKGKNGTNLVFLGDKVVPQSLAIASGTIMINYTLRGSSATSTKVIYAKLTDNTLEKTNMPVDTTVSSTQSI